MEKSFYLVSCVSKKAQVPTAARDLYQSQWFKKARRYVEQQGGEWLILSALHGVVRPDQIIAPYDQTLSRMPIAERRAWAAGVLATLESGCVQGRRCVILAGSAYREFLIDQLRRQMTVAIPMEGMAIGRQLQWLSQHTAR
ncbi:DUF6884 domain-containing protein [Burkholderia gladioli]|uniref:DUF6884 domain-containing protein n=1 Tax=Burkholderia gladioli TaxID=28095 RepID=UPI001641CEF2|nr:DUF6884 domain-containing protein [Burkholderia gladioli]